jgi:membrane-associated phospholipid phosphatase
VTRRIAALEAASGAAFLVVTVLVWRGSFDRLDQEAVSHLMPWLVPNHHHGTSLGDLTLPPTRSTLAATLVSLWTYPASVLVSFALVLAASLALARRGRPRQAAAWLGGWLAANVVEVLGKAIVTRPALYSGGLHVVGFDQSYPSGHTVRALVAAAAVASVWPRARPMLAWALIVPVALVALGDHTPTDVAGGVLLAVGIVATVLARGG